VCPVRYELGFYIPEDDSIHSRRRENHKSYIMVFMYVGRSTETDTEFIAWHSTAWLGICDNMSVRPRIFNPILVSASLESRFSFISGIRFEECCLLERDTAWLL
jgi:hypothetical protein